MQYNNYLEKIKKIAAFLSKLYRHMIIVAVGIVVIAVSVSSMVAAKGTITEEGECPAEVIYGELPTYEVDAVFGKVSFEYCEKGSGQWSEEAPVGVGEYSVRAVTKAAFGAHKYGREQSFTIKPREIVLSAKESKVTYGDSLTPKADNLHKGDSVSCSFIYEDITASNTNVCVDAASVKIVSSSGADMTANYIIVDTPTTALTFLPRALTITVDSETKIYDNKVLTCNGYEAREGDLVNEDTIVAVSTPAEITEVGEIENTYEFRAFTKDGRDISVNYRISVVSGVLTVEKRPLHIITDDAAKVYDGTPLQNFAFTLNSADEEFLNEQGHVISATGGASITDSGNRANRLSFRIVDASNQSIERNYDYSMFLTLGTLTVTPRPISITTEGYNQKFDGESHTLDNFDAVGKVSGHTVRAENVQTFKDAVNAKNEHTVIIRDAGGRDVTENYKIGYTYGDVVISKRDITITTGSLVRSYQDKWFDRQGYTITEDGIVNSMFKVVGTYPRIKDVGEIVNEIQNMRITYNGTDVDIDKNFNITENWGILTVGEAQIKLSFSEREWTYGDLAPTTLYEGYGVNIVGNTGLISGHSYEVYWKIDSNTIRNYKEGGYDVTIYESDVVIKDANGNRVTDNYIVSFENDKAKAKINKRHIEITSASETWTYDSTVHTNDGWSVTYGSFAYDDKSKIEVNVTGSIIDYGSKPNTIAYVENDITKNYIISCVEGTLTVNQFEIKITSETRTWEYDGTWKCSAADSYGLSNTNLPIHDNFVVTLPTQIRDKGTAKNTISVEVTRDGVSVIRNYNITRETGTLEITPRKITIETFGATKIYDGKPLKNTEYKVYDRTGGVWGTGDTATVDVTGSMTYVLLDENGNVQSTDNTFDFYVAHYEDGQYVDATYNYEVTPIYGQLRIDKREVNVVTASDRKAYDGNILTNSGYTHELVSVIAGQTNSWANGDIPTIEPSGAITNKGFVYNSVNMETYVIMAANGMNVTDCYSVHFEDGILSVDARDITVTLCIPSNTLQYTGKMPTSPYQGASYWQYAGYSITDENLQLVNGQRLKITTKCVGHTTGCYCSGCIGCVGTHQIGMSSYSVSGYNFDGTAAIAENYNITYEVAEVTVEKRALAVSPQKSITQHIYDSTNPQFRGTSNIALSNPLAEGQSLSAVTYFTGVNCNGNVGTYGVKFTEIVIVDADGVDVTHNYDIVSVETVGYSIKINPRPITIVASDIDAVEYNGKAHVSDKWEYDINTEYRLVSGHEIYAVVECKGHEDETFCVHGTSTKCCGCVGKHPLVIKSHTLVGTDENNYTIKYSTNTGYCEVVQRDVEFVSESKSWQYDGNKHWHNEYTEYGSGIVDGQTATLNFKGFGPDVGKGENEFDVIGIYDANDLAKEYNLKSNYNITQTNGTLIIYEKVVITFNWTVTQQYNGNVFDYNDMQNMWTSNIQGVDFKLGMLNVGKVYVRDGKLVTEEGKEYTGYTVKVTVGGVDITDGCEITFECSFDESLPVMEIVPYEITLTAPTEEHIYNADKTAIENLDQFEAGVEITKGKLLSGHRWEILKYEYENGVVPTAGAPAVTVVYEYNYKIFDAENIDVTENYLIHCVNGVHSFAADDTEQATE